MFNQTKLTDASTNGRERDPHDLVLQEKLKKVRNRVISVCHWKSKLYLRT